MDKQIAGINISDYAAKKSSGALTIAKVGNAYAIAMKVFSPETGKELQPQVYGLSLDDLKAQKTTLEKSAKDLQSLITDFEKLL